MRCFRCRSTGALPQTSGWLHDSNSGNEYRFDGVLYRCWTVDTALRFLATGLKVDALHEFRPEEIICLHMLLEENQGPDSDYAEHLGTFPRSLDLTVNTISRTAHARSRRFVCPSFRTCQCLDRCWADLLEQGGTCTARKYRGEPPQHRDQGEKPV